MLLIISEFLPTKLPKIHSLKIKKCNPHKPSDALFPGYMLNFFREKYPKDYTIQEIVEELNL